MASPKRTFPQYEPLMDSLFSTPPFKRMMAVIKTANIGEKQDLLGFFHARIASRMGADRRYGKELAQEATS